MDLFITEKHQRAEKWLWNHLWPTKVCSSFFNSKVRPSEARRLVKLLLTVLFSSSPSFILILCSFPFIPLPTLDSLEKWKHFCGHCDVGTRGRFRFVRPELYIDWGSSFRKKTTDGFVCSSGPLEGVRSCVSYASNPRKDLTFLLSHPTVPPLLALFSIKQI